VYPDNRKERFMAIIKIKNEEKPLYMDLLLIADESVDMIEKYLYRGEMFALYEDDLKALCVITQEEAGVYEIKNIVTVPKYQRKGYGKALIAYITDYYKDKGSVLYVGTGDCPSTLNFYESCGFTRSHVVKNFFVDNYDHPMYENGIQLVDMVYLKRPL
jgi:GNAT superfamily N-acetyltransferase